MELLSALFQAVYNILNIEFVLLGISLTLWMVFIWSVVAFIVLWVFFSILKG